MPIFAQEFPWGPNLTQKNKKETSQSSLKPHCELPLRGSLRRLQLCEMVTIPLLFLTNQASLPPPFKYPSLVLIPKDRCVVAILLSLLK